MPDSNRIVLLGKFVKLDAQNVFPYLFRDKNANIPPPEFQAGGNVCHTAAAT